MACLSCLQTFGENTPADDSVFCGAYTNVDATTGEATDSANPNGSSANIAGICNRERNVFGLMPHPEHAVDPLTGPSADGLGFFASVLARVAA